MDVGDRPAGQVFVVSEWLVVVRVALVVLEVVVAEQLVGHGGEAMDDDDDDEMLTQFPSFLGRQVVHDFPDFTQAHPLQEPVLLHRQHAIPLSCSKSSRFLLVS